MYTAAKEFHYRTLPKLQLLSYFTIGQFQLGLSGDNIVDIATLKTLTLNTLSVAV